MINGLMTKPLTTNYSSNQKLQTAHLNKKISLGKGIRFEIASKGKYSRVTNITVAL